MASCRFSLHLISLDIRKFGIRTTGTNASLQTVTCKAIDRNMNKFSDRIGITNSTKEMQIDSMDDELMNGLWNSIKLHVIDPLVNANFGNYGRDEFETFCQFIWHNFYKLPVDTVPYHTHERIKHIRDWFFHESAWFEIYNFIELITKLNTNTLHFDKTKFISFCETVLEREFAGFRFINGEIAPITNKYEINEVETALNQSDQFTSLRGVNIHLKSALSKLSDKSNPDYRNSIKESISAIESIAKVISQKNSDSLSGALDKIKGKINLHSALEKGFKQIYGYTSDASGIRHALMDNTKCEFEDAKYMLISCSAFINYLITKTDKAGIKLI